MPDRLITRSQFEHVLIQKPWPMTEESASLYIYQWPRREGDRYWVNVEDQNLQPDPSACDSSEAPEAAADPDQDSQCALWMRDCLESFFDGCKSTQSSRSLRIEYNDVERVRAAWFEESDLPKELGYLFEARMTSWKKTSKAFRARFNRKLVRDLTTHWCQLLGKLPREKRNQIHAWVHGVSVDLPIYSGDGRCLLRPSFAVGQTTPREPVERQWQ